MLFEIKLFSFVEMFANTFEAILDRISLKKCWQVDTEDKNFRQKLHFVIQGKQYKGYNSLIYLKTQLKTKTHESVLLFKRCLFDLG